MKLYLLLKMSSNIEYTDPISKLKVSKPLENIYGYCPIFKTKEEAEEYSENGKFKIVEITT